MQQPFCLASAALALVALPVQLTASPTWCAATYPDAVFCEDWDRYCTAPPADPNEACPVAASRGAITRPWQTGMSGCAGLTLEDYWITSAPFSGRAPSKGDLGNTLIGLAASIRSKFGESYTQIIGTDDSPIVFDFNIDSPPYKISTSNIYVELTNQTKQPLTDYILSNDCAAGCGSTIDPSVFPIICRQTPRPASSWATCPPIEIAPILPSIAAGAVSFLDSNPCHCEGTDHFARTEHLAFFDGRQWWTLSQALFPGTFQGSGDFRLHARKPQNDTFTEPGPNRVILTIKSTMVKVEMYYVTSSNPEAEYSWCEIPRQYLGPFSILNFGYAEPCRLKNSGANWECATIRQCVNAKLGGTTTVDNLAISGGIGYGAPGACCTLNESVHPPTIGCVIANGAMDCSLTYGGQFKGAGTVCGQVPCCPVFLPDHDMDNDVDLEDFGWFQTCLSAGQFVEPPTIGCHCANLDGDEDVDTADFEIFARCLTGPGVAVNPACAN